MKTILKILLIGVALTARSQTNTNTITLAWTASPDNNSLTSYVISSTTNLITPFTPVVTVPAVSNQSGYSVQLLVTPGQAFYVCQSSNFWGLGPQSNYAYTPPIPIPPPTNSVSRP